ncbi:MAG: CoA transferase, partial [Actinomycetia bacterium]|nr:CoA transferase [Actinomycetes bacterium]
LSRSEQTPGRPAPPIPGEHTSEVLAEFDFTKEETENLMDRGVVAGPER